MQTILHILGVAKVMVFNTGKAWISKSEPELLLREEQVVILYIHRGNTHRILALLTEGYQCSIPQIYVALCAFERKCAHKHF